MKDFDFDEIDRAVNSFISKNSDGNSDDNVDVQKTDTDTKSLVASDSSPVIKSISGQIPSLAGRRSGQFMDMVRPSNPQRGAVTTVVPERQAIDLSLQNEIAPVTPPTDNKPQEIKPVVEEAKITSPLSVNEELNNSLNKIENYANNGFPQVSEINKVNNSIVSDSTNQLSSSLPDSPFISGAKVEKRPLGAFSEETTTQPNVPEESVEQKIEPDLVKVSSYQKVEENEEKPVVFVPSNERDIESSNNLKTPLPPELQNDLLLIESDNTTTDPNNNGTPNRSDTFNSNSQANSQLNNQTSIQQQYQEKPSSANQNSGAIYDTDSYHKSLARPEKKKSGWVWVLWIVLLLALGAGAGAAVYYFVLPIL